jgi:Leucine-rich repeat (LRR) protein
MIFVKEKITNMKKLSVILLTTALLLTALTSCNRNSTSPPTEGTDGNGTSTTQSTLPTYDGDPLAARFHCECEGDCAESTTIGPVEICNKSLYIDMSVYAIDDLTDFRAFTEVLVLNLGYNDIEDISPLSSLTTLIELTLYENLIEDISPLEALVNLELLDISFNFVEDISSLQKLTKLQQLDAGFNKIEDISALSALTELDILWINANLIKDISPLADLGGNLRVIDISFNKIEDISVFEEFDVIVGLDLAENPVNLGQLNRLYDKFPEADILFDETED